MKIGIDLDDVVFEFVRELIKYFDEKKGINIDFEDFHSYRFSDVVDLSSDEIERILGEKTEDWNLNMGLCEFARDSILELALNHEICFITSRVYRKGTSEVLSKYFSDINYELHFSSNPYVGNGGRHKGEICLDLGIDYMVEDSPEHALNCVKSGVKCFLIEKPWNKDRNDLSDGVIRVKNWKEILEKLGVVENEFN